MTHKPLLSCIFTVLLAFFTIGCKESPADAQTTAKQDSTRQDSAAKSDKNWSAPERIALRIEKNYIPSDPDIAFVNGKLWMTFVGVDTTNLLPGLSPKLPRDIYLTWQEASEWVTPLRLSSDKRVTASYPFFVFDRAGTAHVVWGEHLGAIYSHPAPPPDHLFYANVKNGVVSPTQTLYAIENPGEFDRLVSRWKPVIDAEQNVYVPYDVPDSKVPGYNAFAKRSASGVWKKNLYATSRGVNTSVALTQEGFLLCAFIAADTTVQSDANSVFFTRSNDGGETWSNRVLVSRSGNKKAFSPVIFNSPNGEIHIVWIKDLGNGYGLGETIWHSVSKDEGQTWSQPIAALPPQPKGLARLDVCAAAVDRVGRLHLAFQFCGTGLGPPYRPYYLRYEGGAWREPEHLFGLTFVGQQMGMAIDEENKTIHLVLQTSQFGDPRGFYHTTRKLE